MTIVLVFSRNKNIKTILKDYDLLNTTIEKGLEDGHLEVIEEENKETL